MDDIKYLIKIIGNDDYVLTNTNSLLRINKCAPIAKETDTSIYISLYGGIPKWYKKDWIKLIYSYNLTPPKGYEYAINYFEFKNVSTSHRMLDKHIVILKEPIAHKTLNGYRMIARLPNYFINEKGEIYCETTCKYVVPKPTIGTYPKVSLRDQAGRSLYASRSMHKLVALTWVPNDDFTKKPILDHIDGNKKNYHASNLRWVSFKENADFAYEQNLKNNKVATVVKKLDTGEETIHESIRKACEYLNISPTNMTVSKLTSGKIVSSSGGKYLVRINNSNKENSKIVQNDNYVVQRNTSIIEVTINGELKVYASWREIKANLLKVDPVFSYTIPMIVKKIKRLYPSAIISYKKLQGAIATNTGTGDIVEADTIEQMAKMLNMTKSTVTKYTADESLYNNIQFKKRWVTMKL